MISQKTLKLYVYVDGINDVPFYGSDAGEYEEFILLNGETFVTSDGFVFNVRNINEQIEIGSFRYDAKRMGGAPTITFTLMYPDCLDNFWSEDVYATFNGEKYFLKQTPTSSLSNDDCRYKHEVELISERVILDNVYFFDALLGDTQDAVSNKSVFSFFGTISDFKDKLNASLRYAGMQEGEGDSLRGWQVIVDGGLSSEGKFISFSDVFFSNAIQESYNTFKIPYYFKGKEIHFGYTDNTIATEFSYGVDDALLSITKNNANYKVVNRVTATGSSENLPYYYPNPTPKGSISLEANSSATFGVVNGEIFSSEMDIDESITYKKGAASAFGISASYDGVKYIEYSGTPYDICLSNMKPQEMWFSFTVSVKTEGRFVIGGGFNVSDRGFYSLSSFLKSATLNNRHGTGQGVSISDGRIDCGVLDQGSHTIKMGCSFPYLGTVEYTVAPSFSISSQDGYWERSNGDEAFLADLGIKIISGTPSLGDTITQRIGERIPTSSVLMPPKYRDTLGVERFYNATNGTYTDDNGETIVFANPFVEGHPKEHIITVDDIKPTIKEKRNADNLRIDMFSEFAYDDNDNDETYVDEDGNTYFKHPYFYGKLRVMDFNLFDHANENQPMTISFTSGHVGACNFEIGATEDYPQKNPVQVDDDGNLKRDDNGMVLAGVAGIQPQITEFQPRQQDTSQYEVWIALKKDEETYGTLMPNGSLKPKACTSATANDGDTFVILGINLPQSYIDSAEERLEKEIIKYIQENNIEKFNFSIKFSRIYFEENPDILELLDENARIYIWYNNHRYTLYVSSISYYMESGGILPEITVELDENLATTQNAIQKAVSEVKTEMGNVLGNIDIAALGTPYFIRKDQDDEAQGRVNFKKGVKFGEGGRVDLYDDNSAKLTIEYLEVTKKATFTSLEIQERTHVGGQILISPAAMNCGEVENILDEDGNLTAYRCYFQTKGQDGEEIFNQFAVGDQAICQTFNAWGSKYYWRLVTGIGEDYIDLSVEDCDEESDVPSAGDKIIQLGHRTDKSRQAAQVLSAHGEASPSFIMYNGINDYTLEGKEVTGILWNPATQEPQMYSYGNFFFGDRTKDSSGNFVNNYITFQPNPDNAEEKKLFINADVKFGAGSEGLSDLSEWQDLQSTVSGLGVSIEKVQDQIDGVVENWNGEGTPTLSNKPAATWIEKGDAELIAHINDTYINIEAYVDDETTPTAGQSWRWCWCDSASSGGDYVEVVDKDGNTKYLHWHPIADSDAVKALLAASEAQATADGKTKTFVNTPYDYSVGDVWVVGDDVPEGFTFKKGDILVSSTKSATYVAEHWSQVVTYAEQAEYEATIDGLNQAIADAEAAAKTYTDEGKAALQESINALDEAKADVDAVYTKTAADGLINEAEARANAAAQGYATAAQEAATTASNAYADGVADDAEKAAIADAEAKLSAAKTELNESIARLDEDTSEALDKAEDAIAQAQAAQGDASSAQEVATAAQNVANAAQELATQAETNASSAVNTADEANTKALAAEGIAQAAQELADEAKELADTANTNASNAQSEASAAKEEAESATSKLDNWASDLVISPFEKQGVRDEYAFVVADKNDIDNQVAKYGIASTSDFNSAYTAYSANLKTIIDSSEETVTIPTGMATNQSNYYAKRTAILEAIASAAKKVADDAQDAADTAQNAADSAQSAADQAQADADAAQASANNALSMASNATSIAQSAKSTLSEWSADNVISPIEKKSLSIELAFINGDYKDIEANYQKYIQEFDTYILQDGEQYITEDGYVSNVVTANSNWESYVSAYEAYQADLESKIASSGTVAIGNLETLQSAFYDARTSILEDISLAIKAEADYSKVTAQEAIEDAANAQARADEAYEDAQEANTLLGDIASDSKLTASEKQQTKVTWDSIVEEYDENVAEATKFGVSTTNYTSKYNTLKSYIEPLLTDLTTTSDIVGTTFRSNFSDYYGARTALLNAITTAAKALADNAKNAADDAQTTANNAQSTANSAQTMASNAQSVANSASAKLSEWVADGVISPVEKQALKNELSFIDGDYDDIYQNYVKYIQEFDTLILNDGNQYITEDGYIFNVVTANSNWEAYDTAYDAYKTDLNAKISASGTVAVGTLETTQANYYTARTAILDDIALSIKAEADYSKTTAQKAQSAVETVASDLDVLTNNFKDGSTYTNHGLVMTSMLAVGDTANSTNVEAFLNGSNFASSDDGHGKLILAAGIPDTSESSYTDPEERAKEAATRIYEDGTTYTNKMVLDDGCSIGDNLKITAYTNTEGERVATIKAGTSYYESGYTEVAGYVGINSSGISTEGTTPDGTAKSVNIGNFCPQSALKIAIGKDNIDQCTMVGDGSIPIGLEIIAPDSYAIAAASGMFAGLRPMTRTITSSSSSSEKQLTKFDHTIISVGDDDTTITLVLPSSPEIGQRYEIWKYGGRSTTYITSNDLTITRAGVDDSSSWALDNNFIGVAHLVCCKTLANEKHWLLMIHSTVI